MDRHTLINVQCGFAGRRRPRTCSRPVSLATAARARVIRRSTHPPSPARMRHTSSVSCATFEATSAVHTSRTRSVLRCRAFALALGDDAAVTKTAKFVASLPKTVNATPARGNLHNGKNLYNGNCGTCHGGSQGNPGRSHRDLLASMPPISSASSRTFATECAARIHRMSPAGRWP